MKAPQQEREMAKGLLPIGRAGSGPHPGFVECAPPRLLRWLHSIPSTTPQVLAGSEATSRQIMVIRSAYPSHRKARTPKHATSASQESSNRSTEKCDAARGDAHQKERP